ncbi:putative zinc finger in N-recognin-domain-containing protein [Scheffersomyces xylosifermentans]|uniref:putative zinc finger in N-recognin-domain-containing protein n=1 Tax=Scheffersomyces xylosifermentans TaxID=1304137 RepID=UPI00315C7FBD
MPDLLPKDEVTAVDYIQNQLELEREARELMPFEPDECTYERGELRQPVFACLTCSKENDEQPIGVCYSCSIQCHSTHELVELFTKRGFVCDCGTTRMSKTPNGACKLRLKGKEKEENNNTRRLSTSSSSSKRQLELPAEDIPSSSNLYNQNFKGTFCSCEKPYNPLEETGNMIQCYFGFTCGEEWYHEECILGYVPGTYNKKRTTKREAGENILDKLPPPGEDAEVDQSFNAGTDDQEEDDLQVPHFPDLEDFDSFICWKCIEQFRSIFSQIENDEDIVFTKLPHFDQVITSEDWEEQYSSFESSGAATDQELNVKRVKIEEPVKKSTTPYSIFLKPNFRDKLIHLKEIVSKDSKLYEFLKIHDYLYLDDPVFEPPEEMQSNDGRSSASGSLLELGAGALSSLPREQAIEGLQAYDKIRAKLREFFKPFAEEGKVVTEEEVRDFFAAVKEEKKS